MRLGFTTSIFTKPLELGEVNLGGLVDFAETQGFTAIELRDDDALVAMSDVENFVKDAKAKGIEIFYAIKNDMLETGDRTLVRRGIERAALCGDGAVMRMLASMSALATEGKKGYTRAETDRIAQIAAEYAGMAQEKGIVLALEHTREPLFGDGETYFGLDDIFKTLTATGGVPANLGITFDPANAMFTALCKAPTTAEKVFEFLEANAQLVYVVHYKTTRGGKPTPAITDADIDNEKLFAALAKVYDGIICVEIPGAAGLAECHRNIDASLEYLRKQGLMGYFS